MKRFIYLLVFISILPFILGGSLEDRKRPELYRTPQKGERAPDFELKTLDGGTIRLSDYIGKKPVVIEFGSYTCPVFRRKHLFMERLFEKYDEEVAFLVIYTIEAHPQGDPSPYTGREWVTRPNIDSGILYRQPTTTSQRKDLAEKARSDLDIQALLLIDDMDNSVWKAYGQQPNSAFLVGYDGRIKLYQEWFEPRQLEEILLRELKK